MDSLYIVMPAYNEEETIRAVVEEWYSVLTSFGNADSRLVVVNDGSRDNTGQILKEMETDHPLLVPLTIPNGGHGAAILYGYHYALEHHADYIFQTDSDGQTLPSEFKDFWPIRSSYDMVIGWRRHREDGLSRILVTKVLRLCIRFCFHVSVLDANTPFRLMKAATLRQYIGLVPDGYNLTNVLIAVIFAKKNCRVQYLPITFRPRQGGKNSIQMGRLFRIGKQALGDFLCINRSIESLQDRPIQ